MGGATIYGPECRAPMQDRAHAGVAMRRTAGVAKSTRIIKIALLSPFPAAEDGRVDPRAPFIRRFGDLVTLLRVDPGNDAAQDLALSAAAAAVADHSIVVESGVEHGTGPEG